MSIFDNEDEKFSFSRREIRRNREEILKMVEALKKKKQKKREAQENGETDIEEE